jgi:hypothetical protein
MLKHDAHKRALDLLESLVDVEHLARCERLQEAAWAGETVEHLPAIVSFPTPPEWPTYPFTRIWDDLEANFMTGLAYAYGGALLKDDRLFTLSPDRGVVPIPETFGVPSVVTDQGRSMSEGLGSLAAIEALIDRGVPDLRPRTVVDELEDFAREVLSQYEKLSQVVHVFMADTQGPFDLAALAWGHGILTALYDHPDTVHRLLDLMTEAYIAYTHRRKERLGEPLTSGYHCCGLRLARGGVHLSDDSSVLCSAAVYREFIQPYNARVLAPFEGGWLHFCGNGNHILDQMLATPGVNAIHLGNPDNCDLLELYQRCRVADACLIWSGSLDRAAELRAEAGGHPTGLIVLTENRYQSRDLETAREDLQRIRSYQPITKAPY